MKINFLKLFLATLLLLCVINAKAYDFYVNSIYYRIVSNTTVAVTSNTSSKYRGTITIPEFVTYGSNTYKVTTIDDKAFYKCTDLKKITIPNGIKHIGLAAFSGCTNLSGHVLIPESVEFISSSAFSQCESIDSITISEGVKTICEAVFNGCKTIKYITIPNSVESISGHALFSGCTNLKSVKFPLKSKTITSSASIFENCTNLTNVEIPSYMNTIGNSAFAGCINLEKITIPGNVIKIEDYAFSRCNSLKEIYIENSTETLHLGDNDNHSSLFSYCPLEKIYLGRDLDYNRDIDGYIPFCNKYKLKTVIINVCGKGNFSLFKGCDAISEVYVLTSEPTKAEYFYGCKFSSVCTLYIPYGSTSNYKSLPAWKYFSRYVEYNTPSQTHNPVTLYMPDLDKAIARWEFSIDGGATWNKTECKDYSYTEQDPERGEICYRVLKVDGTYSEIITMDYFNPVPKAIATFPANETKTVEQTITFTLDVKDDGYTYQWMHNDIAIQGATTNSYSIPSMKSSDAGKYYCVVSNPISTTNSTVVDLNINKCPQVITLLDLEVKTYGDAPFSLPTTTDKGLTINYQSTNNNVATIDGNIVTIKGIGETNIIATQTGNADYLEAPYVSRKLTVKKISQTITFDELSVKTYEDIPFTLPTTTDKGLTIAYQSSNTSVATVEGNCVTVVGAGTTEIIATQTGDEYHYAAAPVSRVLTVNRKQQNITFNAFGTVVYGDAPIELNQFTNKNLDITYTSSDKGVATVSGNKITIVKPGITVIKATQGGTNNYLPAQSIERTLIVNKAPQKIEWYELETKKYGDENFSLPDTTNRGLTINYTSDNTSVATINGNVVSIKGAGTANITATQNGDDYYSAATSVTLTLIVSKSSQTITFNELPALTYGDAPLELNATTSSSDIVTYNSSDETVATISDNILTIVGAGKCIITASCKGNSNYFGATSIQRELVVNRAKQTISIAEISNKAYGDEPFAIIAELSSDQPVNFISSNASILSIKDSIATIRGAGKVVITATQDETKNHEGATEQFEVIINKAELIVTAKDTMRVYGDKNPEFELLFDGFINGDTKEDLDIIPSVNCVANNKSNTGNYNIVIKQATDKNYSLVCRNGILKVEKAPIKVKPIDATKVYGDKNPNFTIEYIGFKNNQTVREFTSQATATTAAKTMSPAGEYAIIAEGAKATNYEFEYIDGILMIEKAPLTLTLKDIERTYGEANDYKIQYAGFKGSDKKESLDELPEVICEVDEKSSAGSYSMTLQGGSDDNYSYIYAYETNNNHAVVKINKAQLRVIADDKCIDYSDSLPLFTFSYDGFVNDDTEKGLEHRPQIACDATSESLPGTYEIILFGGYDKNYEYVFENATLTIVAPSGIGEVTNENIPMQIYTLRGVLVYEGTNMPKTLSSGTYIFRRGNDIHKIYIK